ncbi:family 16 glycoside hydrolase [Dictyobacter kobayashii]|uniref:3-keto-alpha-glucoside-1,2-lyase/3-keto-2-hydroxy-glucal hydratase domain-containing protein n=1 Tax=Dictyobacter kobayashii TaxID=2014872 RepID=A0A402ADF8_9CHLR|nr:family 16 glycoside hydrolase [Dictyobacter kobayashii]GCE17126.1 hypothetical protein KDK_09260 [Dictyobacter kobayashii]
MMVKSHWSMLSQLALVCALTLSFFALRAAYEVSPIHAASGTAVGTSLTDYPRVIRLAHSNNSSLPNGTLIASADTNNGQAFPVYTSINGGSSWNYLSTVSPADASAGNCCVALFEVPQQTGSLSAGTLLLAGTIGTGLSIGIWYSTDQGNSWNFLSYVATGGQGSGKGLWEPDLAIDNNGNLICYFSDERHQGDGYNQLLGHVISTDGGQTWGSEVYDVAVNDNNTRPGMASVVKLPDGSYIMAYEVCGNPGCSVHVRTSSDGDNWGNASNLGSIPQASDGSYFTSTTGLVWSPGGGPNGELILVGKYLSNSPNGGSGSTLLTTTDFSGTGTWYKMTAPFNVNIPNSGDHCANYSSSLLPSSDGSSLLELAGQLTADNNCQIVAGSANAGVLPYNDPFSSGTDAGWVTYGGNWSVSNGVYSDTSYSGQGDKAVVGSTAWSNYTLSGDVQLTANDDDAGFIVRVTDPSTGIDALSGYVVGISSGGFYLGRESNGSWTTLGSGTIPGGVSTYTWYHLNIGVQGCTLSIAASAAGSSDQGTLNYTDNGCSSTTGQIGIRTHSGTASWRNISVTAQ